MIRGIGRVRAAQTETRKDRDLSWTGRLEVAGGGVYFCLELLQLLGVSSGRARLGVQRPGGVAAIVALQAIRDAEALEAAARIGFWGAEFSPLSSSCGAKAAIKCSYRSGSVSYGSPVALRAEHATERGADWGLHRLA